MILTQPKGPNPSGSERISMLLGTFSGSSKTGIFIFFQKTMRSSGRTNEKEGSSTSNAGKVI